jgi:ABC-type transport system substrate-binding protein
MKKFVSLLLAMAMILSLAACGGGNGSQSAESKPAESDSTETTPVQTDNGEAEETTSVQTASGDPVYGGNATILYGDELLQYFDPAMGDNRTYALWLESLWAIDWNEENAGVANSMYVNYKQMDGQIAESWEPDYDANTLTVTIRDDVYFQDKSVAGLGDYDIFKGRQLTAADVAYSYDRLLGLDGVTPTSNTEMPWEMMLTPIDSIEVVDDTTLVFHFPDLTECALDSFMTTTVNIIGPEWDELTPEQQNDWHYAVGTGPYILTDFQLDASMSYVKSENYYDTDERHPENKLPYLDTIKMVQIADSSNILTQFISGQIDIISFGSDVLNSSEIQQLKDSMGEGNYNEIDYYSTPIGFAVHSSVAPLDDVNVRIAIQEAIDTQTITQALYGDAEYVEPGFWAEQLGWTWEMDEATAATYQYNPDDARQRLADAGYPNGFDLPIYLRSDNTIVTMMQMVSQYLSQVGINVTLETCADTTELNSHGTNSAEMCGYYSGVGGQFSVKFAQMGFLPSGPAYGLFNGSDEWEELGNSLGTAATLDEQAQIGTQMDQLWREGHWCIYGTGCIVLHQFYSTKMGGVTGEQLCCNNNTRTMAARLWSVTGE